MLHVTDKINCPIRHCNKCDSYRKESEKYKRKYEIAKSGLTKEERDILIELICNEQIKHYIIKNKYDSEIYESLEKLKRKLG